MNTRPTEDAPVDTFLKASHALPKEPQVTPLKLLQLGIIASYSVSLMVLSLYSDSDIRAFVSLMHVKNSRGFCWAAQH